MEQTRRRSAIPPRPDPWQRIDAAYRWDELVLPAPALAQLRSVPALLSERYWTGSGPPGDGGARGVLLLFAGAEGTGKTMAAQVLGTEMGVPVLGADLEGVYAGGRAEAARLMARLFASAQRLGAVLELGRADLALSDAAASERPMSTRLADADLRDLFERCASHPGVVVFPTTRTRELDPAALARFDATIEFPFPEAPARATMWRRRLPPVAAVTEAELDDLAGSFALSGQAIAASCAVAERLARSEDVPVGLPHIARALEREYETRLLSDSTRAALARLRGREAGPVAASATPLVAPGPPTAEVAPIAPTAPVAEPPIAEPPPGGDVAPEPEPPAARPEPEGQLDALAPLPPDPGDQLSPPAHPPQAAGAEAESPDLGHGPIDDAAADRLVQTMAASAATTSDAPEPRRRRGWARTARRLIPLLLLGVISAIVLGLAASKQRAPVISTTASNQVARAGELSVRYPSTWQRSSVPAIRGLGLRDVLALSSSGTPSGRLIIGIGRPQSGDPLPQRFIADNLTGTPPQQLVTLGGHHFYRVLDPRLSLGAPSQSVYALSAGRGPVIAICQTSTQAFTASCERTLATLQLATPATAPARSPAPQPNRAYASALGSILSRLSHTRAAAAHELALARTAKEQAKAAGLLAGLHAQASGEIAGLRAGSAARANAGLATALRNLADAYGTLGRAALHDDSHGYRLGQTDVARETSALTTALGKLAALGYAVR
jgi:DNA polymerase III delta prime subunit